jgi:AraC family ethanolamine operon transcriptional activator
VAIRRIPRYDLAAKALLVIDAGCNAPDVDGNVSGSLAKIAEIIGTTPRAIQYAFRSALGITPYQYILARRLHCVRHDLRINGRGRAPVTEAAFDYGFFDLGRFARHYQRLFCEAPSQTLARARKSSVSASMPIA